MDFAPTPVNEAARLRALRSLNILDTPREERFDRIVRIAHTLFDVSGVLLSFIDKDRQWFKAASGLEPMEGERAVSICAHAILGQNILEVEDTLLDPRFADNPFVTDDPFVRFYAGRPLYAKGQAVGTLCLLHHEPRKLRVHGLSLLDDLAAIVERELKFEPQ